MDQEMYRMIFFVMFLFIIILLNEKTKRPRTIDFLISQGWSIDKKGMFLPPDQTRRGWGAIWKKTQYKGKTIHVPHYANVQKGVIV